MFIARLISYRMAEKKIRICVCCTVHFIHCRVAEWCVARKRPTSSHWENVSLGIRGKIHWNSRHLLSCPCWYNCNPVEIFLEKSFLDKDIFEEFIDESSWWTESFQIKIFFKSLANWFLGCPWRCNCNPLEIFLEKSFLES